MGVIIGFGTDVTGIFSGTCAISAQWGVNPNTQRLYCLGSFSAYKTIEKPTETLNVTVYSPPGGSGIGPYDIPPSNSCTTPTPQLTAGVNPASCDAEVVSFSYNDWQITSYSYSKSDAQMPGQETWGLTRWVAGSDPIESPAPTVLIRGITEGSANVAFGETDGSLVGLDFEDSSILESLAGSVSAGQQGTSDRSLTGVVERVGAPVAGGGDICNGSANIPITPMWL
jgi:hypothetical protein